jgi:hypothetical protein
MGKGAPFERARPFWKGHAPSGEGAPLLERARPFWIGHVHFDLVGEKGHTPFGEGAPLWGRALSKFPIENLTYWFSIQYPDGVVQVVSTKGVAVSIAGCRLEIWSSQIFFYRQPTRQASTKCPLPALKQLNFCMQIPSQLSWFPNSNNDHCDLGFSLTVCDVVRRLYRGHEAVSEDTMLKRGGGVCGPPMALVWGGRMDQLLVQVEEGGLRPCRVEGESSVEVWRW